LSNRVFKDYDDIALHCCRAWDRLIDPPWKIMSIGMRDRAHRSWSLHVGITRSFQPLQATCFHQILQVFDPLDQSCQILRADLIVG